jgi:diacylglycerol kinase family enzyme
LDLRSAVRTIGQGRVRAVDVGEVNGRCFINNSSIGLYPRIVIRRDRQSQRLGRGKWTAMLMACASVFRRYPLVRVVLRAGEDRFPRTTPFVFVGNNRYDMSLLSLGGRPALDKGELCVYFANRTGRFGLVRLMFRALLGRLEQADDFDSLLLPELRIETRKKTLRVALDGEVTSMRPPLEYRIRPGALKVIVP